MHDISLCVFKNNAAIVFHNLRQPVGTFITIN